MRADGQSDYVCGVFDGHGLLGEQAAAAAVKCLRSWSRSQLSFDGVFSDPHTAMAQLFDELHAAVMELHERPPATYTYPERDFDIEFELQQSADLGPVFAAKNCRFPRAPIDFGCTAVVAIVVGDRAVVANAGDSAALLCRTGPASDLEDRSAIVVSVPHTARLDTEVERIERDFENKAWITPDGYLAPLDPVLSQYELQLTRCLGHKLLAGHGLIPTPLVRVLDLCAADPDCPQPCGLVLCSDGITDELSPKDISDRVGMVSSASEACEVLCSDAQDFCMDAGRVDDCTAVVLLFHQ